LDVAGPSSSSAPGLDLDGSPGCASGNPRERRLLPARRLAIDTEIARQRRQDEQALFDRFKGLQATGRPISAIAQQLGVNRRRLDRWGKVRALPTRRMMPPRPGSVETFRAYLRQRWDAGYRNGRMLFEEIRALGYGGRYKALHKVVSPWRLGNVAFEHDAGRSSPGPAPVTSPLPMNIPARQIAPQIAAALLAKPRTELTGPKGRSSMG
jgi:hypothetical protein